MSCLDPLWDERFVLGLRQQMVRFAVLRLHDRELAEDAVQEAFLGALSNVASFSGRSAMKTWMFGILKNKIADSLRHQYRQPGAMRWSGVAAAEAGASAVSDDEGDERLHARPASCGNPEAMLREKQLWKRVTVGLSNLPPRQARVFLLRELLELETEAICNVLEISAANLHTMLHRARSRLREDLAKQGYSPIYG